MKRLLLVLFTVLAIGCAGTQSVESVYDKPSDYIACDDNKEYFQACFDAKGCEDVWYFIGADLAREMKEHDNEGRVPFDVFEAYRQRRFVGYVYSEARGNELWMVVDAVSCNGEGKIVDESRAERKFEGVTIP